MKLETQQYFKVLTPEAGNKLITKEQFEALEKWKNNKEEQRPEFAFSEIVYFPLTMQDEEILTIYIEKDKSIWEQYSEMKP